MVNNTNKQKQTRISKSQAFDSPNRIKELINLYILPRGWPEGKLSVLVYLQRETSGAMWHIPITLTYNSI